MPSSAKTIIFDLDGTLVDSAPIVASILNDMRNAKGLEDLPLALYRDLSSQGGATLVGRAMEIDPASAGSMVDSFRQRYASLPTPVGSLYPSARDTLEALHHRGCRLAICSNKPERLCLKVLKETDILQFFHGVVGGDTAGVSKPDRRPVDFAMASCAGTLPAFFVGDSIIDQQAAQNAALPFIHFSGGYEPHLDKASTHRTIARLDELVDIAF